MTETKPNLDPRAEYIAGLRMLADLLEAHPDLVLPAGKDAFADLTVAIFGDDQREQMAAWTRALPGEKRKGQSGTNGDILTLNGQLRGLHLRLICDRDEVCERVVVGTKTETKTVKDPALLAEVPEVEVTEQVEIVEWRCTSILAGAAS